MCTSCVKTPSFIVPSFVAVPQSHHRIGGQLARRPPSCHAAPRGESLRVAWADHTNGPLSCGLINTCPPRIIRAPSSAVKRNICACSTLGIDLIARGLPADTSWPPSTEPSCQLGYSAPWLGQRASKEAIGGAHPHGCAYAGGGLFSGIGLAHRQAIAGALSTCFITSEYYHTVRRSGAASCFRWLQRDHAGRVGMTSQVFLDALQPGRW